MHPSSLQSMTQFRDTYVKSSSLFILDVGSCDVNGTYRPLFTREGWRYCGLDICAGPNVDIVSPPFDWLIASNVVDVLISGQCIEHVTDVYAWFHEVGRVLRPGGLCCVIAPWFQQEHRYPKDCWRFLPDGLRFLLSEKAGLTIIECRSTPIVKGIGDCIGIARKPDGPTA